MCQIIDYVVKHQPDRPLILMFHNVEIIPGASPYPQTGEEVQRYITSMSNVFKHASSLGVTACSLKDYAEEFTRKNMTSYTPKTYVEIDTTATKPLAISHDCVVQALDQAKVQPWFRYIFEQRQSRPDVLLPVKWIEANSPKTSSILSIGGGTGFNMLWLAQQGFTNLTCLDIDSRALAAGKDLATQYNFPVTYREDDALKPKTLDNQKFDIIEAVNWLSCVPNLEFDKFVQLYCNHLTESGILIFDVIDSTFTQNWHSQDSRLPEAQRRPSEYKTRLSETEVLAVLLANQLHAITTILVEGAVPKRVYIAAKSPASNPSHLVIPSITAKHSKFATFKQLVKKCMVKSRLLPKGINK